MSGLLLAQDPCALAMSVDRIGKYRLTQHLLSTGDVDEYRAIQVDKEGAYVQHVHLCGLHPRAGDGPEQRAATVNWLHEFQDNLTLPGCLPIIDVIPVMDVADVMDKDGKDQENKGTEEGTEDNGNGKRPGGVDIVVASRWNGGCSLSRLLETPVAPGWKLTLYILTALCASLSGSYRLLRERGDTSTVAFVSTERIWIDAEAVVTLHNPFVGPGSRVSSTRAAKGRDVAALQLILRRLTTEWSRRGASTPRVIPDDIKALTEITPRPDETAGDLFDRFGVSVGATAKTHGADQRAAVEELGAYVEMFEREASVVVREKDTSVEFEIDRMPLIGAPGPQESGADLDPTPGSDRDAMAGQPGLASFKSEPPLPGPAEAQKPEAARSRWARVMTAAAVVAGVVGLSALLIGQGRTDLPDRVPPTEDPRGTLDLSALDVSPSDAGLYLVLAEPGQPRGERVFSLDPGEHEVEIRANGHETTRVSVTVSPGGTVTVSRKVALAAHRKDPPVGHLSLARLTLDPPDASVLVDDAAVTGGERVALPPGLHTVTFVKNGFERERREVTVTEGEVLEFDERVVLTRVLRRGSIIVTSDVPVEIFQDGERRGSTPYTGQFDTGSHTLEFRHEGLVTQLVYQVQDNQIVPIELEVVRVNSEPFGQVAVRIEGAPPFAAGITPGRIVAPVGATLLFTHPEFDAQEIRLEPDQTAVSISFADP